MTWATARKNVGKLIGVNPVRVRGRWTGGGAATDCTRTSGRGITSVKYNSATGRYIITFDNVGEVFLGALFSVQGAAGAAASFAARPTVYSAANKTLTIDVTDFATPTNHDLALTEILTIDAEWDDSDAA